MADQQQRITLAQSVNIAKDMAIYNASCNKEQVTVDDVAALVESIYIKLFKETCNKVARASQNIVDTDVEKFIKAFASAKDPIAFRNENRETLASFTREDRDKILNVIGE
jgi:dihydrodipicolinate synthase/N-acetylneuraminate lyase